MENTFQQVQDRRFKKNARTAKNLQIKNGKHDKNVHQIQNRHTHTHMYVSQERGEAHKSLVRLEFIWT